MKCRLINQSRRERGIALVITLVMLAIVTVMAIVFLAVSRRERSSVKMAEDMARANSIAEMALERAKAEAIARMATEGSKLYYDMFNSTNFVRPSFDNSQRIDAPADPDNVGYTDKNGNPLSGTDYLRMLANLQYDARPPVFIETNLNPNLPPDFRFYLDFNRNRLFESNGWINVVDFTGKVTTNLANVVGDPEWIGVLERPDYPHSETNRFIGRMAYMVMPAGKQLDINAIHNQVFGPDQIDVNNASQQNGFNRSQGVGSWEINLAAFLRELNTNTWTPVTYRFRTAQNGLSAGNAFDDARGVLAFRYDGRRQNLKSAEYLLSPANVFYRGTGQNFGADFIDEYADDQALRNGDFIFKRPALIENDNPSKEWAGSFTTNGFTDIQQLFSLVNYSGLPARLQLRTTRTNNSTEDRYTFYRLASQLGVDSTPALKGKLNLNYDNSVGEITNALIRWATYNPTLGLTNPAVRFVTNAADLMLKATFDKVLLRIEDLPGVGRVRNTYYQIGNTIVRTNFAWNNIQIYNPLYTNDTVFPYGNEYTPVVHRVFQLAMNIYDTMTNHGAFNYPTVLRPVYYRTETNLSIIGFQELPANANLATWRDPRDIFNGSLPGDVIDPNVHLLGEHMIVGAKKGYPNLNELALQSYVEVSRKLEVAKSGVGGPIVATNQQFLVSLQQRWGMEAWNSYMTNYPRPVQIVAAVVSDVVIRDLAITNGANQIVYQRRLNATNTINRPVWTNLAFEVAINQPFPLLNDVAYSQANGFKLTNQVRFTPLELSPRFHLITTNDVIFWIRDGQRVIDVVSFNDLVTVMDLSTNLYSPQNDASKFAARGSSNFNNMFWDPTPVVPGSSLTVGVTNQLAVSTGEIDVDDFTWRAYKYNSGDKRGGIAGFRDFMGLGLRPTDPPNVHTRTNVALQTPFVPTRRFHQTISWQANDPLVHYMAQDLTRPPGSDKPLDLPIADPPPGWNIGALNDMYHPWGGHPRKEPAGDRFAFNVGLQDPGIRKSDDWEFPGDDYRTNNNPAFFVFPNLGALGRVHRGTPWQTVYLKSVYAFGPTNVQVIVPPALWQAWSGSVETYPMNDWRLLDVFTTAASENSARGLLSVNQTNQAAWSAVLSGITVATNAIADKDLSGLAFNEGLQATNIYKAITVEPGTPQMSWMVETINRARALQGEVIVNPNLARRQVEYWVLGGRTNRLNGKPMTIFQNAGEILSAPGLSIQSPYLRGHTNQVHHVWTDRAVEYIPSQMLSLVQRDEPRFVVYAFGQSLKPASRSLSTQPDFYNICTNYQISGEVITKTTFRVEGELRNPNNPLRTVVENYQILPPPE